MNLFQVPKRVIMRIRRCRFWFVLTTFLLFSVRPPQALAADALPMLSDVDLQPLVAQVKRVAKALELLP